MIKESEPNKVVLEENDAPGWNNYSQGAVELEAHTKGLGNQRRSRRSSSNRSDPWRPPVVSWPIATRWMHPNFRILF